MPDRLSTVPFSFLFTAGPNGSLFVHSLFDAHPEVLSIPTFMNYYGFFAQHRHLPPEDLVVQLMYNTQPISTLFRRVKTPKAGDFSRLAIDNERFQRTLVAMLRSNRESARFFLLAVHAAYAEATGRDLGKIQRVLVHNHYLQPTPALLRDFPGCGLILSMRNPKGTVYSYYRTIRENFTGYVPSHLILRKLRNMIVGWELVRDVFVTAPQGCLSVRLEDLHANVEEARDRVAAALGVAAGGPVTSTLGGEPYVLSTASNASFSGANKHVVEPKYKEELGPDFERFTESFALRVMQHWEYPLASAGDMDLAEMAAFRFPTERVFNPLSDMRHLASTLGEQPLARTRLRPLGRVLPARAQKWVAAAYRVPFRVNDGRTSSLLLPFSRKKIMAGAVAFNAETNEFFRRTVAD